MNKQKNKVLTVEYTDVMKEFVKKKMRSLKTIKNTMILSLILMLLFIGGIGVLFYFKFIAIALLLSIVVALPTIILIAFTRFSCQFHKMFKTGSFEARKIYVKTSERVFKCSKWYKIVTEDNEKVFYFADAPLVEIKQGQMLHILQSPKNETLKIAITPVREAK